LAYVTNLINLEEIKFKYICFDQDEVRILIARQHDIKICFQYLKLVTTNNCRKFSNKGQNPLVRKKAYLSTRGRLEKLFGLEELENSLGFSLYGPE
jgi:hypothetical protein